MPAHVEKNWKKTAAYLAIANHVLTSSVWAGLTPLQILPETQVSPCIRILNPFLSHVLPGVMSETGAHVFLEQLSVKNKTGLVFDTLEANVPTYVRVGGESRTEISSATVASSQYEDLFLSNPNGFDLNNPNFKNIRALYLIAGRFSRTSAGMVATVNGGTVNVRQTAFSPDDAVKSLLLSGRMVDIRQSQINALEEIYLKVGSYLYEPKSGETEAFDAYSSGVGGLFTCPETLLRSKSIVMESFNHGEAIVIGGMIQSTHGDITIRAKGDVILHKFLSAANLYIETTGQVIFEDEGLVGGNLQIQAANILLKRNISVNGRTNLWATNALRVLNALTSENEAILFGKDFRNYGGIFGGKDIYIKTEEESQNLGCIGARGRVEFEAGSFVNNGDVEAFGGILGNIQNGTLNKGSIRTHHNFIFKSGQFKNNVGAKLFTLGVHQLDVMGLYEDAGRVYSPLLSLIRAGFIDYKGTHCFFGNEGLIKANGTIKASTGSDFLTKVYLQFNSGSDIEHAGHVSCNFGASYPYAAYFPVPASVPDGALTRLAQQVGALSLGHYKTLQDLRRKMYAKGDPRTVVFDAKGKLKRSGATLLNNGAVSYKADDSLLISNHTSRAGVFEGDHTWVDAATALMNGSRFSSPAGSYTLKTREAKLESSIISAATQAHVSSRSLSMNRSTVRSAASTLESPSLTMVGSSLHSTEGSSFIKTGRGHIEDSSTISPSGVTIIAAEELGVHGLRTAAPSTVITAPKLNLAAIDANGALVASGKHVTLKDSISGSSISVQGDRVDNSAVIKAQTLATVKAREAYTDTEKTRIESGQRAELIAPQTSSLRGDLKANIVAIYVKDMDLLELLRHVDAPTAEVRLDSAVILDKDHAFHQTLSLWAKRLEIKANIIANRNFTIEIQGDILNTGVFLGKEKGCFLAGGSFANKGELSLESDLMVRAESISNAGNVAAPARIRAGNIALQATKGSVQSVYGRLDSRRDLTIVSAEDVLLKATEASAARNIAIAGGRTIRLESVARDVDSKQARDVTSVKAGDALSVNAGQDLLVVGARTKSGEGGTFLKAGRHIMDTPLALRSVTTSSNQSGSRHEESLVNMVSEHESRGTISAEAREKAIFYAPHVNALGNITILGKKGVIVQDIHDYESTETHTEQQADGIFGASKKTDTFHTSRISKGAFFVSQTGTVTVRSTEGDVSITSVRVKASQTVLESLQGIVSILQGENESTMHEHERKEDLALIKTTKRTMHEITHSPSSFSGSLTVRAKETIVETVKGQALDFIKEIERNGGKVSDKIVEGLLNVSEESHTAPTAALSAVVAIAASICTAGVGGAIVGAAAVSSSLLAASAAAALSGATSALVTQASLALICCEGDIGKAAQRLASEESLKLIAYSTLTAGVTAGVGGAVGLSSAPHGFGEHLANQGVKAGIGTAARIAQGSKPEDALLGAIPSVALGTLGAVGAQTIGDAYANQTLSGLTQTIGHGVVGGAIGAGMAFVNGGDVGVGIVSGAGGAIIAEKTAELLDSETASPTARLRAAATGNFTASAVAFVTGHDVTTASTTGANATDHNFLAHLPNRKDEISTRERDSGDGLTLEEEHRSGEELKQEKAEAHMATVLAEHPLAAPDIDFEDIIPMARGLRAVKAGAHLGRVAVNKAINHVVGMASGVATERCREAAESTADRLDASPGTKQAVGAVAEFICREGAFLGASTLSGKALRVNIREGKTAHASPAPKVPSASQKYRAEYKGIKPKERIEKTNSYEQGRNAALREMEGLDPANRQPIRGKLGIGRGRIVGFKTTVNGVPKEYRVDYDPTKGPHINTNVGNHNPPKTAFTFPGTEADISKIMDQLGKIEAGKH